VTTLVTGATGFLGCHLLPLLAARGDELRALVRRGTDSTKLEKLGVEVVQGDLLAADSVKRAAAGCSRVFHLAGVVSHAHADRTRLESVNVEGTRTLVGAVEPSARLVHVSSVAAVGPVPGPDLTADERHPFPPSAEQYVYARTKRAAEQVVLEAAEQGLDAVVANPGFLIGPGDAYRVSTWPIWRYLQGTLRITVPGGLSYVDARDAAAGLVALEERGRTGERTILTNREGNLSHEAFFHRVGEVTGVRRHMLRLAPRVAILGARLVPWPVHADEVEAAANWWFFDPGKAERELGFTTRPLDETIADTAAEFT
jgi:nucleoside-diphosphate-sugar epimerase